MKDVTSQMCRTVSHRYPCDLTSPSQARDFTTRELGHSLRAIEEAEEFIDRAVLVVSELMTNAVNAQCHTTTLTIVIHSDRVRVAVHDDATGRPVMQHAAPADDHGRGLQIVRSVTPSWGVDYDQVGKEVWAEISLPDRLHAADRCTA